MLYIFLVEKTKDSAGKEYSLYIQSRMLNRFKPAQEKCG